MYSNINLIGYITVSRTNTCPSSTECTQAAVKPDQNNNIHYHTNADDTQHYFNTISLLHKPLKQVKLCKTSLPPMTHFAIGLMNYWMCQNYLWKIKIRGDRVWRPQ